jgi:hypothetical protein
LRRFFDQSRRQSSQTSEGDRKSVSNSRSGSVRFGDRGEAADAGETADLRHVAASPGKSALFRF